MASDNNQSAQLPTASDATPAPGPMLTQLPQASEGPRAILSNRIKSNAQAHGTHGTPPQYNTPLVGSLNSMLPHFYFKASAAQLKTIIQSVPAEIRRRLRANASKETLLDEVFKLRQGEAITASTQTQDTMSPHDALKHLLTMDASDVRIAVDSNPDNLHRLMHSSLQADTNLTPRDVPENRGDLTYTALTWQVNAHKDANPSGIATASPPHAQPTQILDQQPPRLPTSDIQPGPSTAANPVARRQTPAPETTEHRVLTLNDILASAPTCGIQRWILGYSKRAHHVCAL